jgi:uncharacterized membrane protein YfcA
VVRSFGELTGWSDALAVAAIAYLAIALLSGIVHGYSGFGGNLLMVPLLSYLLAPAQAITLAMVIAAIGQASVVRQAIPLADWRECGPFLFGLLLGLPTGTYFLAASDPSFIRRVVGASTLAAAAVLATGWVYRGPRTACTSAAFGALSGIIGGAAGQGGPPAVAYFIAAPVEAAAQRANIIAAVTGLILLGLLFLAVAGILTLPILAFGALLSLPYLAGLSGGRRLFALLPRQDYRRAALLLLVAAGLMALLK